MLALPSCSKWPTRRRIARDSSDQLTHSSFSPATSCRCTPRTSSCYGTGLCLTNGERQASLRLIRRSPVRPSRTSAIWCLGSLRMRPGTNSSVRSTRAAGERAKQELGISFPQTSSVLESNRRIRKSSTRRNWTRAHTTSRSARGMLNDLLMRSKPRTERKRGLALSTATSWRRLSTTSTWARTVRTMTSSIRPCLVNNPNQRKTRLRLRTSLLTVS
mmetsp:Transcript_73120/g.171847  ORF Transcript_73120/g.171847 Transcript_73120/m.171847 type:complete len:217 (-) Transcript_73120:552-1202(-)